MRREYSYDDVVNYSVDTNLGRSWNTVRKCWCAQLTRAEARAPENWGVCYNIRTKEDNVAYWEWLYCVLATLTNLTALPAMRQATRAQRHVSRRAHDAWLLFGTIGTLLMNADALLLITYLPPDWISKMPSKDTIETDCNLNLGTDKFPVYILGPYVLLTFLSALSVPCLVGARLALAALPDVGCVRLRSFCASCWSCRRGRRGRERRHARAARALALFVTFTAHVRLRARRCSTSARCATLA